MLTIDARDLRLLATYEDTLGPMLLTLAFNPGFEDAGSVEVETREGWGRCEPGDGAESRYGGAPMQGYTRPGSGVVVTLALVDDEIRIHAQGDGWAIDADGPHAGWMQSRDRSWPMPGSAYRNIHAEEPWILPGNGTTNRVEEPRIYGPSGPMRMEDGVLVTVEAFVPSFDEPALDAPAWLRPGYDWDAAVAADPKGTLSRIHLLAGPLGVTWEGFETPRVLHEMMERIEARLGIETTDPAIGGHRLQIGARVAAAEDAVAGRPS